MTTFVQETRRRSAPITVRGVRAGEHLHLTIEDEDGIVDVEFLSPLKEAELLVLLGHLRAALSSAAFLPREFDHLDEVGKAVKVRPVAELGHRIFAGLFTPEAARVLTDWLDRNPDTVIVVRADAVAVPWELLHPEPPADGAAVSLGGFLGHRALLTKISARPPGEPVPTPGTADDPMARVRVIPDGKPVDVGYIFDDALPSTKVPVEMTWHHKHDDILHVDPLDMLSSDIEHANATRSKIESFLLHGHDIIHLQCHAEYKQVSFGSFDVKVRIRKGYWAQFADIRSWRLRGNQDSIFLLGFCDSDTSPCWGVESVARHLQRHGARSVVAVSAPVNDGLALAFTKILYEHLLRPMPVGAALLLARRTMAGTTGNPCCLLFGLSGSCRTVLDTTPRRNVA